MDRPTTNLEEVRVYRRVSNHGTNTEASGMLPNDQPWLDCDPECAKNLAEAAKIWERYAKSTVFWVIYVLPFTKWNHHKAIYLGHRSSATHRSTFISWEPLWHSRLLSTIYIKYHLLKNTSTISTKQQLMAFSIMILNIPYVNLPLRIDCPQNPYAYG